MIRRESAHGAPDGLQVGIVRRYVAKINVWKSIAETLFIGGAAAVIAYYIGFFLRWLVTM